MKWDLRFLELARFISAWSKDNSTCVGAVITDSKRVVSVGFNGHPQGVDDTHTTRERKIMRTLHAEENAIAFANRDIAGCTIYVTHPPCSHCAAHIIQRGLKRVVAYKPDEHFLSRWQGSYEESLAMFEEAGVIYMEYDQ